MTSSLGDLQEPIRWMDCAWNTWLRFKSAVDGGGDSRLYCGLEVSAWPILPSAQISRGEVTHAVHACGDAMRASTTAVMHIADNYAEEAISAKDARRRARLLSSSCARALVNAALTVLKRAYRGPVSRTACYQRIVTSSPNLICVSLDFRDTIGLAGRATYCYDVTRTGHGQRLAIWKRDGGCEAV
jgi:hypothetical protein